MNIPCTMYLIFLSWIHSVILRKNYTHTEYFTQWLCGCIGRRHWSCRGPGRALANSQLSQSSQNKNLNLREASTGCLAQAPTSAHHFSKFRDEKTHKCNSIIFLVHSFISWTRLIGFTVKIGIECIFTFILFGIIPCKYCQYWNVVFSLEIPHE